MIAYPFCSVSFSIVQCVPYDMPLTLRHFQLYSVPYDMPLARGGCVASFVLTLRHHYGLSIVIPAYVTKATHVVLFLSALMPCISYLELS